MLEENYPKFGALLEQKDYFYIKKLIKSWESNRKDIALSFYSGIYNYEIYMLISNHKIKLAKLLAAASKVDAIPEDRSRIVFLLARFTQETDLTKVNEAFKTEFGPCFKIFENYIVNNQQINWKKMAMRAAEIHRGLYNFCYLLVMDQVDDIMTFFDGYKEQDIKKINYLIDLAQKIFSIIKRDLYNSPSSPDMAEAVKLIKEFYKLTNRIQLDIDKIDEADDFMAISRYLINMDYIAQVKASLINSKVPPNDRLYAEKFLLKKLGQIEMDRLLDDDLLRTKVPLKPIKTA